MADRLDAVYKTEEISKTSTKGKKSNRMAHMQRALDCFDGRKGQIPKSFSSVNKLAEFIRWYAVEADAAK